jgi:hypothetical protein
MDDQTTPNEPVEETEAPESAPAAVEPDSGQTTGSELADTPPQPAAPPEVPDEDAPVIVPSPEPAPVPQLPEPDAPQVSPPQTLPPEQPDEDAAFLSESAPIADSPPSTEIAPSTVPLVDTPPVVLDAPMQSLPHGISPITDAATLERLGLAKRRELGAAKLDRILAFAKAKGHFTSRDIRLQLVMPKRTADVYLDQLVASGRLSRRGSNHSTEYWFVQ